MQASLNVHSMIMQELQLAPDYSLAITDKVLNFGQTSARSSNPGNDTLK